MSLNNTFHSYIICCLPPTVGVPTVTPSESPRLEFTSDDDGDSDEGFLTGRPEVVISVVVCSTVLLFLLAVLTVAVVKLVQFLRSSQNFK